MYPLRWMEAGFSAVTHLPQRIFPNKNLGLKPSPHSISSSFQGNINVCQCQTINIHGIFSCWPTKLQGKMLTKKSWKQINFYFSTNLMLKNACSTILLSGMNMHITEAEEYFLPSRWKELRTDFSREGKPKRLRSLLQKWPYCPSSIFLYKSLELTQYVYFAMGKQLLHPPWDTFMKWLPLRFWATF